jgi:CheY-like chemotaxis protein
MKRILFVDDDPHLLAALRAVFRRERERWEMVFTDSGTAALVELGRAPFDLVISDHRMPGMDGLELLARVRAAWPATIRVMLSGTNDTPLDQLEKVVDKLIGKPCSTAVLRDTVTQMLS